MIIAEQEYKLVIGRETVPFKIVKGKRNRVRLFFSEENELIVETGSGKLEAFDRKFLEAKSKWVSKGFTWYKRENLHRNNLLSGIDNSIIILGKETPLTFIEAQKTYFRYHKYTEFNVFAPSSLLPDQKKKLLFGSLRRLAAQILTIRMEHWTKAAGLKIEQLRIRDLRSKWGSCSSIGNISLNWHLIFLDELVIDYVIVHELMHLHEMNHGPAFWNKVAEFIPDYKIHDNKLKEHQWMIGILK